MKPKGSVVFIKSQKFKLGHMFIFNETKRRPGLTRTE